MLSVNFQSRTKTLMRAKTASAAITKFGLADAPHLSATCLCCYSSSLCAKCLQHECKRARSVFHVYSAQANPAFPYMFELPHAKCLIFFTFKTCSAVILILSKTSPKPRWTLSCRHGLFAYSWWRLLCELFINPSATNKTFPHSDTVAATINNPSSFDVAKLLFAWIVTKVESC